MKEVFEAKAFGMTWEQWQELLAGTTHARRVTTLEEMANMAALMASDRASGMTGTTVNLTMGSSRRLAAKRTGLTPEVAPAGGPAAQPYSKTRCGTIRKLARSRCW